MPEISREEIWEFLHSIEAGSILLTPVGEP
jgi:hypothetical protein